MKASLMAESRESRKGAWLSPEETATAGGARFRASDLTSLNYREKITLPVYGTIQIS
jgi:hypothetical protein